MAEFNAQSPAPNISNLNGRYRWDQGSGLQQFDSTAFAVTPTEPTAPDSDAVAIQAAVDRLEDIGGGDILLRNGTYLMDADIIVPSGVTLVGETKEGVIIDFQNQAYQIKAAGTITFDDTSLVAVTNGSTTVTGSGTGWTTILEGQYINLGSNLEFGGIWYLITQVNSSTELIIERPYELTTSSSGEYLIGQVLINCTVKNITVQNSTHDDGAVYFTNCIDTVLEDVSVKDSAYGIVYLNVYKGRAVRFSVSNCIIGMYVENCNSWSLTDWQILGCSDDNLSIRYLSSASISNFTSTTSGDYCLALATCKAISVFDFTINTSTDDGILVADCADIQISSGSIANSSANGIYIGTASVRTMVHNVSLLSNAGYGIEVSIAADEDTVISACVFDDNTLGEILDNGTNTVVIDGSSGGGTVDSVVAGNNIDVDATDPANPIVSVETLTPTDIGLAASVTELDYVDGVTSAIQTQIDGKQPLDSDLTSWAGVTRASGFDTFAATPSSANLASLITGETGSGALVFATSPTLVTPALGTPSALVGTNITGTAAGLTAGTVTTNANLTGDVTSTGNATTLGAVVTNAKLSTSAGEPGAAWASWTPTLSGRLDDGDWTKSGAYQQIGKTCNFRLALTATAAAPAQGGSGEFTISLPVTTVSYGGTATLQPIGNVMLFDANGSRWTGDLYWASTTTAVIRYRLVSSTRVENAACSSTVPFTWTTSDEIHVIGAVEVA